MLAHFIDASTSLLVGTRFILHGNANFASIFLSMPDRVRETIKDRHVTRLGSVHDDTALPINCMKPTAVFIKARVGEHERECSVDTDATVSLVSREFIAVPLKPCSLKARWIGGRGFEEHLYFGC